MQAVRSGVHCCIQQLQVHTEAWFFIRSLLTAMADDNGREAVMLFNTVDYLIFLLIVVTVYFCAPKKMRNVWLFIVSCYFYMQWNARYIILLYISITLTYSCGILIERLRISAKNVEEFCKSDQDEVLRKNRNLQKICLAVCILLNLGILGFYKYFSFGVQWINRLLAVFHLEGINMEHKILLPVGISFYTLQALGYLMDVYRGEIYAEKNFLRYALFVSFFPQLVAGPIERSRNLLVQLGTTRSFRYENLQKGMLLVLYGMFLKMVIADRAAVFVDTVYENSAAYPGFYIVVATVFFAIQIYCDFYGYSTIARGSALIMDIHLMDNFNAPYFAKSVKEFWRRWHISLSGWFRDYLYIPLGGNRKGSVRKQVNLLSVFMVSGLWHGASASFIFWGLLNGIYQVVEELIFFVKRCLSQHFIVMNGGRESRFSRKLFRTAATFSAVTFAWLFFRAGGLKEAITVLKNMLSVNNWWVLFDGSMYEVGIARNYMNVMIGSILFLFVVDYQKYRGKDAAEMFLKQGWVFKVIGIMSMIFTILLYGCYGELYDVQQFIYFQF